MIPRIGIGSARLGGSTTWLKQPLLLFDRIGIDGLNKYITRFKTGRPHRQQAGKKYEWLKNKDLVFDVDTFIPDSYTVGDLVNHEKAGNPAQDWLNERKSQVDQIKKDPLKLEINSFYRVASYKCRALAALYTSEKNEFATSIVDDRSCFYGDEVNYNESNVVNVVLSSFPHVTNDTPFEAILEARRDNEFIRKRKLIHQWIKKISKNNMSRMEIIDELEWLTHEYESYMKLQRLKYSRCTFRAVVSKSGELIENIVKLRLGKGSKLLVNMFGSNIELMEAERNAPGREVSFISHAKQIVKP